MYCVPSEQGLLLPYCLAKEHGPARKSDYGLLRGSFLIVLLPQRRAQYRGLLLLCSVAKKRGPGRESDWGLRRGTALIVVSPLIRAQYRGLLLLYCAAKRCGPSSGAVRYGSV